MREASPRKRLSRRGRAGAEGPRGRVGALIRIGQLRINVRSEPERAQCRDRLIEDFVPGAAPVLYVNIAKK